MSDFRSVSTASARYQQLALNPQKLAGQCGKLKCCLNYELDTYLEALKDFPPQDAKLKTEKGIAFCQKADIFKETLWFSYKNDSANWYALTKAQVLEIMEANKKNETVASLEEFVAELKTEEKLVFENVVGQDNLNRFDKTRKRNRKRKGRKPRSRSPKNQKSEK